MPFLSTGLLHGQTNVASLAAAECRHILSGTITQAVNPLLHTWLGWCMGSLSGNFNALGQMREFALNSLTLPKPLKFL